MASSLTVMLSSAGRQVPLVDAFVRALGVNGTVLVADANRYAPALGAGGRAVIAPRYDDPRYDTWCGELVSEHGIGMWLSLAEEELLKLKKLEGALTKHGCALIGAPYEQLEVSIDKMRYESFFGGFELDVPPTKTLSSIIREGPPKGSTFIVKERFGKGSRGLRRITTQRALVEFALRSERPDEWIVQEDLGNRIFVIDVINDLAGQHVCCLARERIQMGEQETSTAKTLSDPRLDLVARRVSTALRHQGCADVEFVERDGVLYLIDVNVRFGGAHIFSLAAGANIPGALVAWRLGLEPDPEWLRHRDGEVFSRYSTVTQLPRLDIQ